MRKSIPTRQLWLFAYAIPHFENADHPAATVQAYDTGIGIQSFSAFPVVLTVK